MDKVHLTIRPPWALPWIESWAGLFFAILLSTISAGAFTTWAKQKIPSWQVDALVSIAVFAICRFAVEGYKQLKTRHYPGSYIYCFERLERTTGRSKPVLGHFILKCLDDGNMVASGASYDWKNDGPDTESRVRWSSQHVGATEILGVATCYIVYDVDFRDEGLRPYRHGLLRFEKQEMEKGVVAKGSVFRGHMQAVDPPNFGVPIYSVTYAERVGKEMAESALRDALRIHADLLMASHRK